MGCSSVSYCETITAYVKCIKSLIQGTDNYFKIELYDENGMPIDLNDYDNILIHLYTDGFNYAEYTWPNTDSELQIDILQEENTDGITNKGIIGINIDSSLSRRFITGPLYAEIKLKSLQTTEGEKPIYKTITCLVLGDVKYSLTKDTFK